MLQHGSGPHWLLMVHQLPSQPSHIRVRTWRRLREIGAVSIKQAVYVLPESAGARDGFDRLRGEITEAGGHASVFSAASVDAWSDAALIEAFRQSRARDYRAVAAELEHVLRRLRRRRPSRGSVYGAPRQLERFRQRLRDAERLDFFAAPGRDRVVALLEQFTAVVCPADAALARGESASRRTEEYRGRLWVTRIRPGVDRMASAWLIRRFIDPAARFGFVIDRRGVPQGAVPFDMSGVELSHEGPHCTFETLCERFGIRDAAVGRIAAIVHDLDLKDDRFGAPEAPTIGGVIQGLQLANASDETLLAHGMALFEALYRRKTG